MFGNPSAALAAPAAAGAAGFGAILTHEASDVPFMVFAPNELMVVSALTGLDMPSSPRIPVDENGEPEPTRAVGVVPRPRKLRMLDSIISSARLRAITGGGTVAANALS
jgi:hypothetical protein